MFLWGLTNERNFPSQASREPLGLRVTATECHDGEAKTAVYRSVFCRCEGVHIQGFSHHSRISVATVYLSRTDLFFTLPLIL